MSLVEYSNQLRKRGKPEARAFPPVRMQRRRPRTSSHTQVSELGAAAAFMADYCFVQDAPGKELFTILDKLYVALGMMAAISVEEKGPATYVVSVVVKHLRAWGWKKVTFRIDGEPAIRALGVAIQYARSEETVVECRPKYSSPSMGPVENMNRGLCGLARCFRIYLREKAKLEITTESPLLPCSDAVDGSRTVTP